MNRKEHKDFQSKLQTESFESQIQESNEWWYLKEDNSPFLHLMYPLINLTPFLNLTSYSILTVGDGRCAMEGRYLNKFGHKVTATDYNTVLLEETARRGLLEGDMEHDKVDAENIKYEDCLFDVCIAKDTLHHLNQPYKAIYEMERVASKMFWISEPCAMSYKAGGEQYETVGNFKYNFTVLEMVKAAVGMNMASFCYKHEPHVSEIISDLKVDKLGGAAFAKKEGLIYDKIISWEKEYIKREAEGDLSDRSSVVSFLFMKERASIRERKLLGQLGYRFPKINRFDKNKLGEHQTKIKGLQTTPFIPDKTEKEIKEQQKQDWVEDHP